MKYYFSVLLLPLLFLSACSTNPATGRNQFSLMGPQQEASIGASEHQKIIQQFGVYNDPALQRYVTEIGNRIVPYTENPNQRYTFTLLDSDMVNAFALPGGYVYVTRGLLALANSEAELAAVIAHEIGHVTGRHSAERYSRGVVTGLGAAVLGAAIENPQIGKALNTGADLYLRSYSRGQENEADALGIRYTYRAGYDPFGMARFLQSMQMESQFQSTVTGKQSPPAFLSTHPDTGDRVAISSQIAGSYPANPKAVVNRDVYLKAIDGMVFGDAHKQGFTQGQTFFHPKIGFKYTSPRGFEIDNREEAVISKGPNNTVIIFDFASNNQAFDPQSYLQGVWMRQEPIGPVEQITVNGMRAATAGYQGSVGGQPMMIRLVAIEWEQGVFARFQMAYPPNAAPGLIQDLQATTYSFARMSESEKRSIKLERINVVTAGARDSVASLAARQPFERLNEMRFRVLNGLGPQDSVRVGEKYKVVVR